MKGAIAYPVDADHVILCGPGQASVENTAASAEPYDLQDDAM